MYTWQKTETITLWIVIVIFFVLFLVLAIIAIARAASVRIAQYRIDQSDKEVRYQKELTKVSLAIQEEERKRIAADIHDTLISRLTAIYYRNRFKERPEELNPLLKDAIDTARRISHDLTPPLLEYSPLHSLIQSVFEPWKDLFSIQFFSSVHSEKNVSNTVKLQLIRIFQELITNTVKHAEASEMSFLFRQSEHTITAIFRDNGKGIRKMNISGMGLKNIETRIQYLNAGYKIKTQPGKGVHIIISFKIS